MTPISKPVSETKLLDLFNSSIRTPRACVRACVHLDESSHRDVFQGGEQDQAGLALLVELASWPLSGADSARTLTEPVLPRSASLKHWHAIFGSGTRTT